MFFIADHKPDDGFVLEYKEMTPHQTKLISVYGGYLRGYPCCRSLCTEKMSPQQNFFVNRASKYQNYCGKKFTCYGDNCNSRVNDSYCCCNK